MDKIALVKEWIRKRSNGTITASEEQLLEEWLLEHPTYARLAKRMTNEDLVLEDVLDWIRLKDSDQDDWIERLERSSMRSRNVHQLRRRLLPFGKWVATAAVVLLLANLGLHILDGTSDQPAHSEPELLTFERIRPAINQAKLVLAEGDQELKLNRHKEGLIFGEQILYEDGTAVFDDRFPGDSLTWVTLEVPKGGKYRVQLSDGTEIWLNAESKLHYPLKFSEAERKVELDGEAYFKVKPQYARNLSGDSISTDRRRTPFFIVANEQLIEVLGTELNVKAYHEDASTRTTLVTGSVVVSHGRQHYQLLPGQKAESTLHSFTKSDTDIEEDIAWKNNKFLFNETELRQALTDIARWYNLRIEYKGVIRNTHFYGEVGRDKDLSQILAILENIGINFRLQRENGINTLIVLP